MDTEELSGLSSDGEVSDGNCGRGSYSSPSSTSSHCPNVFSIGIDDQYSDELDYNESESDDADHTHLIRSKDEISLNDGEVSSNEEGEIRDTPSEKSAREKFKMVGPSSSTKVNALNSQSSPQSKPNRTCRHFLQGRCVWGDQCRFSHENPSEDSKEDVLIRHSQSPVPHHYRPPSYPHRRRNEYHQRFQTSQEPFYFRFPPEPTRLQPFHYLPPPGIGIPHPPYPQPHPSPHPWRMPPMGSSGIIRSVEKIEEDQRWHRLRTITSGWGGDSDDEDVSSNRTSDLRVKLKSRKTTRSSSDESETEKKLKKKKRKKKKEKKKKKVKTSPVSSEEWVDPWVRSNNTRPSKGKRGHSSEEESVKKIKKRSKYKSHAESLGETDVKERSRRS